MQTIYLDVCCLNRPFDDQRQARIRLETDAIWLIIQEAVAGRYRWVSSEAVSLEIEQNPNPERRRRVEALNSLAAEEIRMEPGDRDRGRELEGWGFGAFDALHIACAERAGVDIVLTTDDGLLKRAKRHASQLRVRALNPVAWLSNEG